MLANKTKMQRRPLSEAAIEAKVRAFAWHKWANQKEWRILYVERLQKVLITPKMLEGEINDVRVLYEACLHLQPHDLTTVGQLHRQLAKILATDLWNLGTVGLDRARVLNCLEDILRVSEMARQKGWDGWDSRPGVTQEPKR